MKIANNLPEDLFHKGYFWILAVAAALVTIYFGLLWKADDVAHLGMSGLFILAVGSIIWDKKETLKFKTNLGAILVAVLLIAASLYALTLNLKIRGIDLNVVLRVMPFTFGIALALIASGFPGLRKYWRELAILFALGVPSAFLTQMNISPITAQFSSFMLWSIGYNVGLEGINLIMPNTTVLVAKGCSGIESINYLLGISVLYLIMFPLTRKYILIVPIVGVVIAFVVNLFRVAAMSILINYGRVEAFKYWHEGEGSLVVGVVAVFIFSVFYFCLLRFTGEEEEEAILEGGT